MATEHGITRRERTWRVAHFAATLLEWAPRPDLADPTRDWNRWLVEVAPRVHADDVGLLRDLTRADDTLRARHVLLWAFSKVVDDEAIWRFWMDATRHEVVGGVLLREVARGRPPTLTRARRDSP